MTATPILIDCDPGHDDAIALLLALASPEVELLGVTSVAGNQTLEKTTANAIRVLEFAGHPEVPVAAGADRPLVREQFVAAEGENVASFSAALQAGKPTRIALRPTLADGLAIPQVGANAFEIARSHVDQTVIVTEEQIAISILRIVELEKGVVEGAAATPLAACLSGQLKDFDGKKCVLLLCGGNVSLEDLCAFRQRFHV